MKPSVLPDPANPGRFVAIWQGGQSSNWKSQAQAQKHAEAMAKAVKEQTTTK